MTYYSLGDADKILGLNWEMFTSIWHNDENI